MESILVCVYAQGYYLLCWYYMGRNKQIVDGWRVLCDAVTFVFSVHNAVMQNISTIGTLHITIHPSQYQQLIQFTLDNLIVNSPCSISHFTPVYINANMSGLHTRQLQESLHFTLQEKNVNPSNKNFRSLK